MYLSSDCLVSLAEVFLAGQPNNDTSVLTALNNTKTHLSKHTPSFCCSFAVLVFFMFVREREGGVHLKERRLQFCVMDQPPILSFANACHLPPSRICHPDPSNLQSLPPGYSLSRTCLLNQTQLQLILVTQTRFIDAIASPSSC